MGRLTGKRAVITGAANGIGRASSMLFAFEGARVGVMDRDGVRGQALVEEIRTSGGDAIFLETDVTEPDAMEAAIARAVETYGGLDIMYNNAGGATSRDGKVTDMDLDEFWRTIKVDLFGTFLGCRYAIPQLVSAGGGSIINTTSIRALTGTTGADAYSAAKGGVLALTRALALQWGHANIRVNAISPGVVLTERVRSLLAEDDPIKLKTPLALGEPGDVAEMALYLASPASSKVTGAILPMDGGASAV